MNRTTNPGENSTSEDEWNQAIYGDDASARKQHRRTVMKRAGKAAAVAAGLAIVVVLVLLGVRYVPGIVQDYRKRNEPPADNHVKMSNEYTDGSGARNPAAGVAYSGGSTTTDIIVDHRSITVKGEKSTVNVTMPSLSADISAEPCQLKNRAASCYFGSAKAGAADIDLYAFRDASTSSLLMTTEKPVKVHVQGAALAYTQPVSVGDQKDMHAVIIINKDQTGIMIIGHGIDGSIAQGMTVAPVAEQHADNQSQQRKE